MDHRILQSPFYTDLWTWNFCCLEDAYWTTNESFLQIDLVPTAMPKVPVTAGSYMARECGATEKFTGTGIHKSKVPTEVYNHLSFKKNNFMNGYFAMQSEEKGTIIKVR